MKNLYYNYFYFDYILAFTIKYYLKHHLSLFYLNKYKLFYIINKNRELPTLLIKNR